MRFYGRSKLFCGTVRLHKPKRGDLFICAQCQADAKQSIEIQASIRSEAGEVGASMDATDNPANS